MKNHSFPELMVNEGMRISLGMQQEPRPLIDRYWPALGEYADQNWKSTQQLQLVLAELKYRKRAGAVELRKKVTERLVELSRETFIWPRTAVASSSEALDSDQFWYENGLLSFMGYRVGQNGADQGERRRVLDYVYNERVPRVNSAEYMDEWGEPETAGRLQKMAESIAAFARNGKRRGSATWRWAIEDWEGDLEYLRTKYYVGRYDRSFTWPDPDVT